jgi:hypothetical protein
MDADGKAMGLKKFDSLLGSGELRRLAAGARQIRALERLYRASAPPELAAASRVKACKAGTLFVVADNAAVAAKLRQMTGGLLEVIRKSAAEIDAIRFEVQVGGTESQRASRTETATLSREAVGKFAALAQNVPEGSLKKAIADLVKHHSPRKKSRGG